LQLVEHVGGMRLLPYALIHALPRIANLQPSVVAGYLRSAVGVHHPDEAVETVYSRRVHHAFKLFYLFFCSSIRDLCLPLHHKIPKL